MIEPERIARIRATYGGGGLLGIIDATKMLPQDRAVWEAYLSERAAAHEAEAHAVRERRERDFKLREAMLADLLDILQDEIAEEREYAEGTKRVYETEVAAFKRYVAEFGVDAFPATPELVAAYIVMHKQSESAARNALQAIARVHSLMRSELWPFGLPSPGDDPLVKAALRYVAKHGKPSKANGKAHE